MGQFASVIYNENKLPDHIPVDQTKPTFDPHYGFKSKRIQREMKITRQELMSLNIRERYWDYCAHLMRDLMNCQHQNIPFTIFCRKEFHALYHCREEDYILRMKEHEREKRLRIRQKKLEGIPVN